MLVLPQCIQTRSFFGMRSRRQLAIEGAAAGRRVTYLSLVVNLALAVAKCAAGWFGRSSALVADGLNSFSDLASDAMVLFGLRMAVIPGDEDHPYGHHRFNTSAAAGVALMIVVFSIGMMASAVGDLLSPPEGGPALWTVAVALISIIAKEVLYRVTRHIAHRYRSRLLFANAWHHRSDSFSSIVTAFAIVLAALGGESFRFIDALGGLLLGGWLLVEGGRLLSNSVNDLLDRAPALEILNDLREHILPTSGVHAYHHFRARNVGDLIEIDFHLQVAPDISVEAGHEIARQVRRNIMTMHPQVRDVLIHIDPATEPHLRPDGLADFNKNL